MDKIYLASQSPRRKELIGLLGWNWEAVSATADEAFSPALSAEENVREVALRKARGAEGAAEGQGVVLGVDTVVRCGALVFGKPAGKEDCLRMLRAYSGSSHEVVSGAALIAKGREETFSVLTKVHFMPLSEEEMLWYAGKSEPYDKAGGYGIQGIASRFVSRIEGDYYNVMGFPLHEIYCRLRASFGFSLPGA
jgi:septum formation protein